MKFNSLEFLLFFPLVLLLYWKLPSQKRYLGLLAASYFFYLYLQPQFAVLLLATTLVSFVAARSIARSASQTQRRAWLAASLFVCLGSLFFFKYLDFTYRNVAALGAALEIAVPEWTLQVVLPVGISFFTFQTLSYVIDVYRGTIAPETNLGYYALFVSFFPQLVAGPIERPGNLLPQLHQGHTYCDADLVIGLRYMLSGFFKKLVIADAVAPFVQLVYDAPRLASGPQIVTATLLFALQIYCDFSGYSDIAIGAARMMGIHLMENFRQPYAARSLQEFWRRWHISLSAWFMDYLYIPMGGSQHGGRRHARNLLLVFLVSGLWHGANWTFLAWGALHGIALIAERALQRRLGAQPRLTRAGAMLIVCLGWLFFRARSLGDAWVLLSRLGTDWTCASLLSLGQAKPLQLLLSLLVLRGLPKFLAQDTDGNLQEQVSRIFFACLLVFAIALGWMATLHTGGENAFIYFQF